MPIVQIKGFNASNDNEPLVDQPVKANKKRMKIFSKFKEIMNIQQEN